MSRRGAILLILAGLLWGAGVAAGPTQDHQNATRALMDSVAAARPPCPPCPNPVPVPTPDPVPTPMPPGQVPNMSVKCAQVGHGYSPSVFWKDWCVRDSSGGPCGLRWCDGPGSPPAYGIMWRHTQGNMALPPELSAKGWVEFEFFFDTITEPNCCGGKHIFCVSSSFWGTDIGPGGLAKWWSRPDVGIANGKARISYYSADGNGKVIENHQVWVSNQPANATQKWVKIKYAWDRYAADKLRITLNDAESKVYNVHPDSEDPGQYLYFGNMDKTYYPDGSSPTANNMDGKAQVRYRNIRWGN